MKLYQITLPIFCLLMVLFSQAALSAPISKSAKGAAVKILHPADGATISGPVKVVFGIEKMTLIPAGIPHPDSGHHHLLIDVDTPPKSGTVIPSDAKHLHFGKGQEEAVIDLKPGKHTLQLLLGDHLHRPHQPPIMSDKITIKVEKPNKTTK